MGTVRRAFSAPVAAKLAGISERQCHYWETTDLAVPSIVRSAGTGQPHQYALEDIIILRAIKRLKDGGVSVQSLRKVAQQLKAFEGASFQHLFLTADNARDVLLRHEDELISMLRNPGQLVFTWILNMADIEQEVTQAVERMAAA